MGKESFQYTNGQITVVWKPNSCIHSTKCWKGLISVFNPQVRPWIRMEGASAEKITEQVKQCPSGALSYFVNDPVEKAGPSAAEPAAIPKIEVPPPTDPTW